MILDEFRLEGRVALVTGATRGLGRAGALALAEAGADIVGLGRSDLTAVGEAVMGPGRRWLPINADLERAAVRDLEQIVTRVVDGMGRLDILVNNAGIVRRTPAIEYSEADWDAIIQVNLKSVFFLSQAAARVMLTQGKGKIMNIASLMSALCGSAGQSLRPAQKSQRYRQYAQTARNLPPHVPRRRQR